MTSRVLKGNDGRMYIVTSDSSMANNVTQISEKYIYVSSDTLASDDNLVVKLLEPEPLSVVPMKDIILEGK